MFAHVWAVLLSLSVVLTLVWPNRWVRLVLVAVSIAWFPINRPVEGDILWVFTPNHGLTQADLFGVAGLAVALLTEFSPRRRVTKGRR